MKLGKHLAIPDELVRVAKFALAGAFNIGAGYLIFFFFSVGLGLHYLVSYSLAVILWTGFGYEVQRRWVFRAEQSGSALTKYLVPQILFWLAGLVGFSFAIEVFGISPQLTYFLNLFVMSLGFYAYSRFVVFSHEESHGPSG